MFLADALGEDLGEDLGDDLGEALTVFCAETTGFLAATGFCVFSLAAA